MYVRLSVHMCVYGLAWEDVVYYVTQTLHRVCVMFLQTRRAGRRWRLGEGGRRSHHHRLDRRLLQPSRRLRLPHARSPLESHRTWRGWWRHKRSVLLSFIISPYRLWNGVLISPHLFSGLQATIERSLRGKGAVLPRTGTGNSWVLHSGRTQQRRLPKQLRTLSIQRILPTVWLPLLCWVKDASCNQVLITWSRGTWAHALVTLTCSVTGRELDANFMKH